MTRDSPPTPPSRSGRVLQGPGLRAALYQMFSHQNYSQICLADFLASGPPLVVFATVDRIFPASVSEYSSTAALIGTVISIPAAAILSRYLAKTSQFYETTVGGYTSGGIFFR